MKKLIIATILFVLSFEGFGQGQPSGFPITSSSGWIKYGYLQNDSGRIDAKRDTLWTPSKVPTTVYWQHAGVDTAWWTFNGKTSGQKWDKGVFNSSGGSGTSGWGLTGNAGTNPATNFLGTTDAKPFSFITNGILRGIISSTGNFGIGTTTPTEKLDVDGTIKAHTGIKLEGLTGVTAELSQPSGGKLSLYDPVGVENIIIEGTSGTIEAAGGITFSGLSLSDTTTVKPIGATSGGGLRRLAYWPAGGGSSQWTTSGNDIYNNNSGKVQVKQNLQADSGFYLLNSTSGVGGNIYKNGSLWLHNKGDANSIFFGIGSGASNAGVYNYGLGYGTLNANTTGTFNIAIGVEAMNIGTNHSQSIAIGNGAMKHATNDGTVTNAIVIGSGAGDSLASGYSPIIIGKISNPHFISGIGFLGIGASQNWRSGDFNTLFGSDLAAATALGVTGSYNTLGGGFSNFNRKSGNYNTAWGNHTLVSDTIGDNNTAIGSYAGTNNNGSYNGFFGNHAGAYQLSATGKIILSTIDYGNLTNENLYSPLIIQQSFGGSGQTAILNTDLTVTQLPTGIPSGAKRVLATAGGRFYLADTTAGGSSGTVTSVATGYGLSGGTITSTGTLIADSSVLMTKGTTQVISGSKWYTAQQINTLNGAASTPPLTLTGTWFTGGSATTTKPQLLIQPSGATSTAWNTSGTGLGINAASGFTGMLADFQLNGTSKASIGYQGDLTITGDVVLANNFRIQANGNIRLASNQGYIIPVSDGVLRLTNTATTGFTRLNLGLNTSSGPAIAVNGTGIDIKLADNSAYTGIQSLYDRFGSGSPESVVTAPIGAVYHRTDGGAGTSLYVKESGSGNTGWVAK